MYMYASTTVLLPCRMLRSRRWVGMQLMALCCSMISWVLSTLNSTWMERMFTAITSGWVCDVCVPSTHWCTYIYMYIQCTSGDVFTFSDLKWFIHTHVCWMTDYQYSLSTSMYKCQAAVVCPLSHSENIVGNRCLLNWKYCMVSPWEVSRPCCKKNIPWSPISLVFSQSNLSLGKFYILSSFFLHPFLLSSLPLFLSPFWSPPSFPFTLFLPLLSVFLSFLPPPRWVLARVLPAKHCGWMVSTLTWGSLTWRDTCPSLAEYVFTCMFYHACNQLLCMSLSVK